MFPTIPPTLPALRIPKQGIRYLHETLMKMPVFSDFRDNSGHIDLIDCAEIIDWGALGFEWSLAMFLVDRVFLDLRD